MTAGMAFATQDVMLPLGDFTRWAESFLWGKHPIAATRFPCILLPCHEWKCGSVKIAVEMNFLHFKTP